jgi:hypothetical protein
MIKSFLNGRKKSYFNLKKKVASIVPKIKNGNK